MFDHNGSYEDSVNPSKQNALNEWDKSVNTIPTSLGIRWYGGKISSSDVIKNLKNTIRVAKMNTYEGQLKEDYINSNLILDLFIYSDKGMIWLSLGKDGFYGYTFNVKYQSPNFNYTIRLGSEAYDIYKGCELNRVDIDFAINNIVTDLGSNIYIKFCTNIPANNESGKNIFILNGDSIFGRPEYLKTATDITNGSIYRDNKDVAFYKQSGKYLKDITQNSFNHIKTSNVINYNDIVTKTTTNDSLTKFYFTTFKSKANTKETSYSMTDYNLTGQIMELRDNLSGIILDNTEDSIEGGYISSGNKENNVVKSNLRYRDGEVIVNLLDSSVTTDTSLVKGSEEMMSVNGILGESTVISNENENDTFIKNKANQETVDYKEAPHSILNPTKYKNAVIADVSSNDNVSNYGSIFSGTIASTTEGMNVGTYQPLIKMVSFAGYKIFYDPVYDAIVFYDMSTNRITPTTIKKKILSYAQLSDSTMYLGTDNGILKVTKAASGIPSITNTNIISGVFGSLIKFNNGMIYGFRTENVFSKTNDVTKPEQFVIKGSGLCPERYCLKDYIYVLYNNGVWYELNELCENVLGAKIADVEKYTYSAEEAERVIGEKLILSTAKRWIPSHLSNLTMDFISCITLSSDGTLVAGYSGAYNNKGIYYSTDNGKTWIQSDLTSGGIYCITVTNDNELVAGTNSGIYYSTDNGKTWIQSDLTSGDIYCITVANDGTLVAGSNNYKGIYYSTDNGRTWTQSSLTTDNIFCITVAKDGTLAAGSGFNKGIYYSTDNGRTWTQSSSTTDNIFCITVANDGTLVAGSNNFKGIYYSTDNGKTWTQSVFTTSKYKSSFVKCITVANDGTLVAGCGSVGMYYNIYHSTDNGKTWIPSNLSKVQISSITVANDGTLVAGSDNAYEIHDSGIYYSTDNGKTWIQRDMYISSGYICCITVANDGTLVAGAGSNGYYSSSNSFYYSTGRDITSLYFKDNFNVGTNNNNIYKLNETNAIVLTPPNISDNDVNEFLSYKLIPGEINGITLPLLKPVFSENYKLQASINNEKPINISPNTYKTSSTCIIRKINDYLLISNLLTPGFSYVYDIKEDKFKPITPTIFISKNKRKINAPKDIDPYLERLFISDDGVVRCPDYVLGSLIKISGSGSDELFGFDYNNNTLTPTICKKINGELEKQNISSTNSYFVYSDDDLTICFTYSNSDGSYYRKVDRSLFYSRTYKELSSDKLDRSMSFTTSVTNK
jgi:photosystem II stability/assembly factor-like uncharacterized protein